nr:uridine diphosphate-N-acetylglucosamine-binding protein YvcK [uncultured Dethiosulfovibrio sp.]
MRSLWPFLFGVIVGVGASLLSCKRGSSCSGRRSAFIDEDPHLSSGPYVVAIGGGTGLSSFLVGLKSFTKNITAIVTVTDEGGSSGRLTRDWGLLPPGDIRNCIVALSENDDDLKKIMDFRFNKGDLSGHSLGNLVLLAATEVYGDFMIAVERVNRLLSMRGRVLPISSETMVIFGETFDGEMLKGELAISSRGKDLRHIWLEPKGVKPVNEAIHSLLSADMIVLGPGSLFTSIIPNLLVDDFREKLYNTTIPVIYIANLMTQPGETEGMSTLDHLDWLDKIVGRLPDFVVVNDQRIPDDLLDRYTADGAVPLGLDEEEEMSLSKRGCGVIRGNFLKISSVNGSTVVRHDGRRVSEAILSFLGSDLR